LLVESMQDYAIFMLDPEGRVTSWNTGAETIEGFQHEEIIGENFARFYTEEDRARGFPEQALRQAALEERHEQEGWRVRQDGACFWANTVVSALLDEHKILVGFSVVMRDLTERRHVEEMLRESEAKLRRQARELEQQLIASGRLVSLGVVTASMAHEFNNPLGIVMGFAQQLLTEFEPDTPNHQALKIIDEETRRCQRIIQELLQFSRPKNADLCPTDVKLTIDKSLNMVSNRLYKQKIEASAALADELPPISADPQQLEQVLINLFLNAIDAMPKGGHLRVEAGMEASENNGGHIAIVVSDSGGGIDPNDLDKIFQPFFSAKKGKGIGLGLSITERIIKNHGGTIAVESEPGRGTRFTIRLPITPQIAAGGDENRAQAVDIDIEGALKLFEAKA